MADETSSPSPKDELHAENQRTTPINKTTVPWRRPPVPMLNDSRISRRTITRPQDISCPSKEVQEPVTTSSGMPKSTTQRRVKRYRTHGGAKAGPLDSSSSIAPQLQLAQTFGQQSHGIVDSTQLPDILSPQPSMKANGKRPAQHPLPEASHSNDNAARHVNPKVVSQYPSSSFEQMFSAWKHLPLRMEEAYAQMSTQLCCAYCFTLRVASLLAEKGQWCDTKMVELVQWKTFVKVYRRSQRPINPSTVLDIEYGSCKSSGSETTAIALHGCTMHKGELEDKGPPPFVPPRPRTPPVVCSAASQDMNMSSETAENAALFAMRQSGLQSPTHARQLTIVRPYLAHQQVQPSRQDSLGQALQTCSSRDTAPVEDFGDSIIQDSGHVVERQTDQQRWREIAEQVQDLIRMEIDEKLRGWICPCANCHSEVIAAAPCPSPNVGYRSASCPALLRLETRDAVAAENKPWLGHDDSDDGEATAARI